MVKRVCLFLIAFSLILPMNAQSIPEKAITFLNTLSPELKARAQFPLNEGERFNMNFVPIVRKGPTFHDFDDKQRKALLDLLKSCLSAEGFRKSQEIMELEKVLIIIENNNAKLPDGSPWRDPLNYHFCIFGNPSDNAWGWRFEGHHISQSFAFSDGKIVSSTPSFFGSNPGIVKIEEQRGKQVLKVETDLGFKLVTSLDEKQLKVARFSDEAPWEIISGNKRKATALTPTGIPYTQLNEAQQNTFMQLLNVYIDNYELGFAKTLRSKINAAGITNLSFGWAGSLTAGKGNYYRIQGPMLLIEYDNTQNDANHVHTVVRDLTNDYAEDILKEHYAKEH